MLEQVLQRQWPFWIYTYEEKRGRYCLNKEINRLALYSGMEMEIVGLKNSEFVEDINGGGESEIREFDFFFFLKSLKGTA